MLRRTPGGVWAAAADLVGVLGFRIHGDALRLV